MKKSATTKKAAVKNGAKKNGTQKAKSVSASEGLKKIFEEELKDIYWAEKHLTKALPKMQKAATSEELQQAIEDHLNQTKVHVNRLEQVFDQLGEKAQAKKCEAMEGLTKEGDTVVEETEDGTSTRDVGIIVSAQKVEHYEISAYGSLITLAKTMGQDEIADILSQTLEEEKEADQLLTQIAESSINWQAEEEDEEEGEGSEEEEEEEK